MELVPVTTKTNTPAFPANDDGMFNASSLAKEYGKDVYGYTRSQKVKDLVKDISKEYELNPQLEFTDKGHIVRVISGGTAPGTWMHLDIFIKFLGWLDPKLERDFLKGALVSNTKPAQDTLQEKLARLEADFTTLKRKLSRNAIYRELMRTEKEIKQLRADIERRDKILRKEISKQQQPKLLN